MGGAPSRGVAFLFWVVCGGYRMTGQIIDEKKGGGVSGTRLGIIAAVLITILLIVLFFPYVT